MYKLIPILLFLIACGFIGSFGTGEILALIAGIVSELFKFRNLNLKEKNLC